MSEDVSLKYLESNGMLPVLKTALQSDTVKNNAWANSWADITKTGTQYEFALNKNGAALNNLIVEEVQAVLLGQKDSKAASKSLSDRLTSEIG